MKRVVNLDMRPEIRGVPVKRQQELGGQAALRGARDE